MKLITSKKRRCLRKGNSLYSQVIIKSHKRKSRSVKPGSKVFYFNSKNDLTGKSFYEGPAKKNESLRIQRKPLRKYVDLEKKHIREIQQNSDMLFSDRIDHFGNIKREFKNLLKDMPDQDLHKHGKYT